MARHIRFPDFTILAEKGGADRVGGASMKAAGEGDDLLAARSHARHTHRILVCLSTGVAKKDFCKRVRSNRNKLLRGSSTRLRVNEIRIEQQLAGLFADCFHDVRMTMSGAGYSMTAVEVEILVAIARVDPNTLAAFSRDRHFSVRGELKLI